MSVITLNREDHTYHDETGVRWPSVTEVLGGVGLIDFPGVNYAVLGRGRDRGSKVHEMLWYFDEGDLDESSIDPALMPYLAGYKKFLSESGFEPELIEFKVHHDTYRFAGTLDRTGFMGKEQVLFDIKTGQIDKWVALQTAAYEMCLTGIYHRYALQLTAAGKYKLTRFSDHRDRQVWLACLSVYNWKGQK